MNYKTLAPGVAVFAALFIDTAAAKKPSVGGPVEGKPNVVILLSDDQSWTDYGFMGHESIETPHLDKLAGESALFRRGYVPTALCRPALMTIACGLYSHQNRTTGNDPAPTAVHAGVDAKELLISHIDETGALPQWLAKAGYVSHQSGKWWEGNFSRGGFTAGMTRGYPEPGGRHGDDGLKIGREGLKPVTDFIDGAVAEEKPFFVWYAPFMPHTPHTPPERLFQKYAAQGHTDSVAKYYAMVEWFDETCGELVDYIDGKGIGEETLIVYVTDNGWEQDPTKNGYMPRSKRSPNEMGTRTPIMFRWPGTIPAADRPELCSSIDIVPTILAATGATRPKGKYELPGLNLLPEMKSGKKIGRNSLFGESFAHDIANVQVPAESLMYRWVIEGKWKLLLTYDGAQGKMKDPPTDFRPQLYDLGKDPGEETNLAGKNEKVVERLAKKIEGWWPAEGRKTVTEWSAEPVVLVDPKLSKKPAKKAAPKGERKGKGKGKGAARTVTNEEGITSVAGFEVEKLYTVPEEMGSWVAMGVDPTGRLYFSDQKDAGVFTVDVGEGGSVEVAPLAMDFPEGEAPLISARGMTWAFDGLYLHLQPEGFIKLSDRDGDGDFDTIDAVEGAAPGNGEHGNHAVIPTEDGKALYIDGGNSAVLPEHVRSRITSWDEDLLLPRMWDARGHARGRMAPGGWVTKFDPETKTQEVYSIGYRNQYDIALNRYGDMFTYDADMEWDMGAPWYRPTRICHVVSGSDYGWRSGSGKWPTYYEDSLPPVVEIGPGSPTGMLAGSKAKFPAKFPAKYRDAIYAVDWTYGTIYAIHLTPEGAGYTGVSEPFVYGAPLPVTDAEIGADGAMYFVTGGRGLPSHLYRVRYTGPGRAVKGPGNDTADAKKAREIRRSLEEFHGVEDKKAIGKAWTHLASEDRFLRNAARVAVESQPVATWAGRVYKERRAQARITGAVALARSGKPAHRAKLIASLLELDPKHLSEGEFLGLLRAYALTFIRLGKPTAEEREAVIAELDGFLPGESSDLNTELLRVLVYLRAPGTIEKGMALIASRGEPEVPDWTELASRSAQYGGTVQKMLENHPPTKALGYAFLLRNLKKGWSLEQRREFFVFLNEAAKGAGGASYPGFMENIREEALANCSDEERAALADVTGESFNPVPDFEIAMPKGPGKAWTVGEALAAKGGKPDFERGRSMFFAASCGACHRFNGLGGSIGPDLTSLPNKFDEAYLLEAIINPSKDISDQYGSSIVTMNDGTVHAGLVIEKGDVVDVYLPDAKSEPVTLSHSDIAKIEESPVSQMPPGLLNALSKEEVRDLVAYLMSGGNPSDRRYGKGKKK